jgi:hypothetical protein
MQNRFGASSGRFTGNLNVFVIPEGVGLCQHVSEQWFCWLSASLGSVG